ncbi:alkaline phosphatase PafA [Marinoscillum sp.]|uniref:alkaline phosphatase PafA n=1 Tax=Marinoscillum sp. TaxID=2024838 RepID=UPI003BA8BCBF
MRLTLLFIITLHSGFLFAQSKSPKLVVGIVVDQMRQDYLQRFDYHFSEGGFKRLINDGFTARNNHYNYIPTYTAPGHASIYTGTTPRYHGIIANDWYSKILDRSVYCVGDSLASAVGGSAMNGNISPRNLQVNTITDELKLSTNFRSKVVGISIKDRGAVLPAGHTPDGAYWYDSRTGEFMTSDFYSKVLPKWASDFNKKKLSNQYSDRVWKTLLPIEEYVQSTADDTPYERGFKGKDTPTFPYNLAELRKQNGPYGLIRSTPFGNTLVLEMAKAAMDGEKLGQDDITDFLAISFSSTDYVGHNFGPNSIELEDTYLRLDRDIANLLNYLDQKVGAGEYLVFLTADHGVVANPQFLVDHHLPGGFLNNDQAKEPILELVDQLGGDEYILDVSNDQIFLDRDLIASKGENLESIQRQFAEAAMKVEEIAETFTATDLSRLDYTDPLRISIQNGFNRKLSGDVLVLKKAGYLSGDYGNAGTSHGSGYTYDTHVPLLFYGAGVKNGSTVEKTFITDIAPTLAMLLNISMPNGAVTGQPIEELFE